MAETQVLKACAINRNATPAASQANGHAQLSGPLPVVNVNMTANGPQVTSGVSRGNSAAQPIQPQNRGPLPVVQVNMNNGQPQIQRVLPVPPVQRVNASGVVPQAVRAPQLPEAPTLASDQLLLCRHLVNKQLTELRAGDAEALSPAELATLKLAETTITAIDATMVARTAAEALALTAPPVELVDAPPASAQPAQPQPMQPVIVSPPQPRVVGGPRSVQANGYVMPRRVTRPTPPRQADGRPTPPMVTVRMDGERPVVDPPVIDVTSQPSTPTE